MAWQANRVISGGYQLPPPPPPLITAPPMLTRQARTAFPVRCVATLPTHWSPVPLAVPTQANVDQASPQSTAYDAAAGQAAFSAAFSAHTEGDNPNGSNSGSSGEEVFACDDEFHSEDTSAIDSVVPTSLGDVAVVAKVAATPRAKATSRRKSDECQSSTAGGTDGAVGAGRMAVPQAVASVITQSVQRRFRQASPDSVQDLRRFVRVGDILNYLGGNRWGHVVMALDPLQAFEVPVLYSSEVLPEGNIPLDAYSVTLRKAIPTEPWSVMLDGPEENQKLIAGCSSDACAAIERWNLRNPQSRILPEDHVVEVNGLRAPAAELFRACQTAETLELKLWRPILDMAVVAFNVPVFAVRVLQSASNMRDISESTVCVAVHPISRNVCAVGPYLDGFRISMGHAGPVEVQIIMSPHSNSTIDFGLFRLAVNEVLRAPHDQKWSMRTAVRSYLRNAALKPDRYKKANAKLKLGAKLSELWAVRPICSTVPARIWQKYHLKKAYKDQGLDVNSAHDNLSAEVAFTEEVLKYMPVKDDRVLPEDLIALLTTRALWQILNIAEGPPPRRLNDRPLWASSRESAGAGGPGDPGGPTERNKEEIRKYGVSGAVNRAPLQKGTKNRDGLPVQLGIDHFTVYCGHQVSRAKSKITRLFDTDGEPPKPAEKIQWDGRCGPRQGPQCASCRWLEDRLVA